jgi:lipoic acid synthetase
LQFLRFFIIKSTEFLFFLLSLHQLENNELKMPKFYDKVNVLRKPQWLKIRLQSNEESAEVERIVKEHSLHTICSSGLCPNKAECWRRRTATFMILGDICTRGCRFCATKTGIPLAPDASEPEKLAESVRLMGLRHVVVTSVTRDDLPDGGARHWAAVVEAIRRQNPDATIELLIPDLDARADLIEIVAASKPDIIGHNIETVERLTPLVRSRAKYRTSLRTLEIISKQMGAVSKSGLMVGLGESDDEVLQTLRDLRDVGIEIVTLGQYLRPSLEHYPVAAYITPEKFEWYRLQALEMGFSYCASAPMVRSSYLADAALESVKRKMSE